ncbi:hypothetical protein BDA99DRAFT_539167 [Phascolomyces articulosus]|uniref:FAS1 domain-containing protein n=1 Tax=Phascolomyces articulosus TaxID=60185 RepID=A0AAD5K6E5_9FUNG|nr:hypothetical protein BDA99DRAFT_539167 [Phascolomyces articulosus]
MQENVEEKTTPPHRSTKQKSFFSSKHHEPQLLYEPNAPDYRCPEIQQSLFDKLAVDASLSTYMSVLTHVESVLTMVNNSQIEHPFTMFVPINAAFANEFMTTDQDMESRLETFLKNHIVPQEKLSVQQLQKTQTLNTLLQDETIQVKYHFFSRRVELNGIAEVDTDHPISANNGIAYKINKLLHPIKP